MLAVFTLRRIWYIFLCRLHTSSLLSARIVSDVSTSHEAVKRSDLLSQSNVQVVSKLSDIQIRTDGIDVTSFLDEIFHHFWAVDEEKILST